MMSARGASGEVRKGYQLVARLGAWELANDRVDAPASEVNHFWIDQGGPFVVRLSIGRFWWVWREAEILFADSAFVVRVHGVPDKVAQAS